MPTIQFSIEQNKLDALLTLTNEKTGTKALQFTIDGYQKLVEKNARLEREHSILNEKYENIESKVSEFSKLLNYFSETK